MTPPRTIYRAAFSGISLLLVVGFSVQAARLDAKGLAGRHDRGGPAVRQVAEVQARRLERVARRQDDRPLEARRAASVVEPELIDGPADWLPSMRVRRLLVLHTDLPPPGVG